MFCFLNRAKPVMIVFWFSCNIKNITWIDNIPVIKLLTNFILADRAEIVSKLPPSSGVLVGQLLWTDNGGYPSYWSQNKGRVEQGNCIFFTYICVFEKEENWYNDEASWHHLVELFEMTTTYKGISSRLIGFKFDSWQTRIILPEWDMRKRESSKGKRGTNEENIDWRQKREW